MAARHAPMMSDAPLNTTGLTAPYSYYTVGSYLLQVRTAGNRSRVFALIEHNQAVLSYALNTAFMFPAEPSGGGAAPARAVRRKTIGKERRIPKSTAFNRKST